MDISLFEHFAPVIQELSSTELSSGVGIREKLLISEDGHLKICYAPFEYINPTAKVVIVGITPGQTQMLNALREARKQLDLGVESAAVLRAAKQTGAFSGAMRPNLVALLDRVGLNASLGIKSCDALFGEGSASHLVQTTSALRNPVFVKGENYNGAPNMTRVPLLRNALLKYFGEDAKSFSSAVFVPLGDKVSEALFYLADQDLLNRSRILHGMPHPSGANAERIAYFLGKKARGDLSSKTDPQKLDMARDSLLERVGALRQVA